MIIIEDKKIILLHNPKTGGLKLYDYIQKNSGLIYYNEVKKIKNIKIIKRDIGFEHRMIWRAHLTYKMAYDIYGDEYKYYTFIRNPYNRCISALNYLTLHHKWNIKYNSFPLKYKLNTFNLESLLLNKNTAMNIKYDDNWYPHFLYQSEYIGEKVNILKYESIEDWNLLKEILEIPNYNINIKEDYILNDFERKLIDKIYKENDIEIYKLYNL